LIENCSNTNNSIYNLNDTYSNLDMTENRLPKKILPDEYFGNRKNIDDIFTNLNSHQISNIDIILKEIQDLMKNIYETQSQILEGNQKIRLDLTFKLINLLIDEIRLLSKIYVLLITDYINTNYNISKKKYLKNSNTKYHTFLFDYLYNNKILIDDYKRKFNDIEDILNNKNSIRPVTGMIQELYYFSIIPKIYIRLSDETSTPFQVPAPPPQQQPQPPPQPPSENHHHYNRPQNEPEQTTSTTNQPPTPTPTPTPTHNTKKARYTQKLKKARYTQKHKRKKIMQRLKDFFQKKKNITIKKNF